MKKSDIITVILIASIGTIIAAFMTNMILGNPDERSVSFNTIAEIEPSLDEPDPEMFNVTAINPTVEVYVGDCQDIDQNGIIDRAELVACSKAAPEEIQVSNGEE
ncbi:hypothetical protein IJG73_03170 [Candidatus Saccharibacteria bacterium]|nr:hypothetical protein [Candidatus Saccharibacteria bacterium]